ncbi:ATP synthase subunit d, mitochondrial-like [Trichogramma pretiosum]|uniref:ATP synthase subunit d, mitochondrial-like n=1 Tax=Trichogramma pretiosum TaxID=7493 RepID=UPI0006C9B248|nr:ATP synthase subunit d, mitochondrial-like [Trichogramma pretiosum]
MAARRSLKAINWAGLIERIPEAEKNSLAAFKAKSDQYFRKVQDFPEQPPKIDWTFYKNRVAVPGLVDKFQKEYESLKIDYPADKYTSQVEAQEKESIAAVHKFIEESNQRIQKYSAEIEKLQGLLKYSEMTMEDFAHAHPDIALDPINRPTIYPHTPDVQPGADDEAKPAHH